MTILDELRTSAARRKAEDNGKPMLPNDSQDEHAATWAPPDHYALPILSCGALLGKYPECRPALIDGLLREGETMNVIAAPKIGKSWLTLGLAFAVATGRPWLSTFATSKGKVLLIDNELHPETSAHRLRTMATKLNWPPQEIADSVHVLNLRGQLQDLIRLGVGLLKIERSRYKLIVIDAFYRALPAGTDENDNATMANVYNTLDSYANAIGASFVLIHHASKGNQSGKAITDVGSGAGAQSRAADAHLVLRAHAEENAVVLDAAVRSFPPVNACCLRWDFPRWTPAPDLDPAALRPERPRRSRPGHEEVPKKPPEPPWTAKRFGDTFGKVEPRLRDAILEEARNSGLSDSKAHTLLNSALACTYLFSWKEGGANSKTLISTSPKPEHSLAPALETRPEPDPTPEVKTPLEPEPPPALKNAHEAKKKRPRKRRPSGPVKRRI